MKKLKIITNRLTRVGYFGLRNLFRRLTIYLENKKGLDFGKDIGWKSLGYAEESEFFSYEASELSILSKSLRGFDITSSDGFLDFGCGKGRVVLQASKYKFGKVSGVEYSPVLVSIANKNFDKLKIKNLKIYNRDARELNYELDDYNYFYFFNPFGEDILQEVLENIRESISRKVRPVFIIYHNPVFHKIIISRNTFTLSKTINGGHINPARVVNIYKFLN